LPPFTGHYPSQPRSPNGRGCPSAWQRRPWNHSSLRKLGLASGRFRAFPVIHPDSSGPRRPPYSPLAGADFPGAAGRSCDEFPAPPVVAAMRIISHVRHQSVGGAGTAQDLRIAASRRRRRCPLSPSRMDADRLQPLLARFAGCEQDTELLCFSDAALASARAEHSGDSLISSGVARNASSLRCPRAGLKSPWHNSGLRS